MPALLSSIVWSDQSIECRTVLAARTAVTWVVVRRAKIVSDLVSQSELRNFRRNATVVVDKCNNAGIKTPIGSARIAGHVLRVLFVTLADATGSARGRSDPSETQRSTREIPGMGTKSLKKARS